MKSEQVFQLYEKLYFHEVEAREKIQARLQLPLAILLSITSIYAIFLKGTSFTNESYWNLGYLTLVAVSLSLHITSCWYFVKAFYGHDYEMIPDSMSSEKYRQQLSTTYANEENRDDLISQYFQLYLFNYYAECSSHNTRVNDERSRCIHWCNTFVVLNIFPLIFAFLIFTLADIDKNSLDKSYKVIIDDPVQIELKKENLDMVDGINLSNSEGAPPPPPPPPKRVIREDVYRPSKPSGPGPRSPSRQPGKKGG
ncbi:hypothetical protein [Marisediminitalea sp.]|uniref:hypothetical protein n=1 Tax=Marisediminitalea sp. TaxID=2662268 RepID=UPI003512E7EE